jgi:hypothetical protein
MKTKKKDWVLIIVGCLIALALLLIFYKIDQDTIARRRNNFKNYTYDYISDSKDFFEKYGEIINLEPIDTEPISCRADKEHLYSYNYMRFTCDTTKAELIIYVEATYADYSSAEKWPGWKYIIEKEIWK